MRLGIVRGHVVLNSCQPSLCGSRLLVVEPITAENLAARNGKGGGKPLIVADQLAPAVGQVIAFTEGSEASNAYWPQQVPVDAYCALIAQHYEWTPPVEAAKETRT